MSTTNQIEIEQNVASPPKDSSPFRRRLAHLLGSDFACFDGKTGEITSAPEEVPIPLGQVTAELCREVARRNCAELIAEENLLVILAVPMVSDRSNKVEVAVAPFLVQQIGDDPAITDRLVQSAERLDMSANKTLAWAKNQTDTWPVDGLLRTANLFLELERAKTYSKQLEHEAADLGDNLSNTYEEISLLHRLTQNLRISSTNEKLSRIALRWMLEVVPAKGLVIHLKQLGDKDTLFQAQDAEEQLLIEGNPKIDYHQFMAITDHLSAQAEHGPVVINSRITDLPDWPFPSIRQVILIRLADEENEYGHMAAINHVRDEEFGTVEASLMSSVGAILGIHSANTNLYEQQAELFRGILRALTSAIDAKDPYTCGHSERVARISTCLARELGCDDETAQDIYLAGLLHDIGKIGVQDRVLRKPGQLTNDEYTHIKTHPTVGHKILHDINKLDDVLPVVLYHHESWDGTGYPNGLKGEEIPLGARIVAVADSYDAMSSNRPYRQGMPLEKIETILRGGAGKQWDPAIIDAFFQVKSEILDISKMTFEEAIDQSLEGCAGH